MFSIAIDGPAAAGKTTQARILAEQLGITYCDTGALYRAVAVAAMNKGIDESAPDFVDQVAEFVVLSGLVTLRLQTDALGEQRVFLNEQDVTDRLRAEHVSMLASTISAIPAIRDWLMCTQRKIACQQDIVMEGRDIGTVIIPQATCKIYLTASLLERAKRRCGDLGQNCGTMLQQVAEDMRKRDEQDQTREIAPLRPAEDAVVIDNTNLSVEETTRAILAVVAAKADDFRPIKRLATLLALSKEPLIASDAAASSCK